MRYRVLTQDEIKQLQQQGCTAESWEAVQVAEDKQLLAERVQQTAFLGPVWLGDLAGQLNCGSISKPAGLYQAILSDVVIGDGCRVANIRGHLAHYILESGCCVEDVGVMETGRSASFGNGVEIEVLNEGGGREVTLFNELSVQTAYMMCVYRQRDKMVHALKDMAKKYARAQQADRGTMATGAVVRSVKTITDVAIGPAAQIVGAARLTNGTILSSAEAPTCVGSDVTAGDFIIAEGSSIDEGVILSHCFVGQGCKMGKQFSAENSLFFANCEGFHGEACSIFAGPYTVTHHKSTLLIAGLFSFYNAGSGTNQSNHMYKLGPVHEGKLARGCKTGSFSYMMWPCCVGPFGVVLGKHTGTFDTSEYPFSHHEARADGKCAMIPGLHITTVGTVRDGAKWPKRDRRKGPKRDRIVFDVFSPYTVGKMMKASALLKEMQDNTDKSIEEVSVGGALVKRPILRTGQKNYRTGIEMYLLGVFFAKVQNLINAQKPVNAANLAWDKKAAYSDRWVDMGGQLMPMSRLNVLIEDLESGTISTLAQYNAALEAIWQAYEQDAWAWVHQAIKRYFEIDLTQGSTADYVTLIEGYEKVRSKFLKLVLNDAEKEFETMSRVGFGQDGDKIDRDKDFDAVRGIAAENSFIKEMRQALADLAAEASQIKEALQA